MTPKSVSLFFVRPWVSRGAACFPSPGAGKLGVVVLAFLPLILGHRQALGICRQASRLCAVNNGRRLDALPWAIAFRPPMPSPCPLSSFPSTLHDATPPQLTPPQPIPHILPCNQKSRLWTATMASPGATWPRQVHARPLVGSGGSSSPRCQLRSATHPRQVGRAARPFSHRKRRHRT